MPLKDGDKRQKFILFVVPKNRADHSCEYISISGLG